VPSPGLFGCLTRIVGEQIVPDGIEMPQRGMAPVLQIGRMSVPAEVEAEWNAWYNRLSDSIRVIFYARR
jgi:hypothetical protein